MSAKVDQGRIYLVFYFGGLKLLADLITQNLKVIYG